jgi:UDPglucose 6-dehydrogenase
LVQVSAVCIAVGTPATEAGEADMSYVEEVSRAIAYTLDNYKVVVGEEHRPGIHPRLGAQRDAAERGIAGVVRRAANPEFLREGSAVRDFLYPDNGQHRRLQRMFRGRK